MSNIFKTQFIWPLRKSTDKVVPACPRPSCNPLPFSYLCLLQYAIKAKTCDKHICAESMSKANISFAIHTLPWL